METKMRERKMTELVAAEMAPHEQSFRAAVVAYYNVSAEIQYYGGDVRQRFRRRFVSFMRMLR